MCSVIVVPKIDISQRNCASHDIIPDLSVVRGARGDAFVSDTVIQGGRSWVRFLIVLLEFCVDIILPVALWP